MRAIINKRPLEFGTTDNVGILFANREQAGEVRQPGGNCGCFAFHWKTWLAPLAPSRDRKFFRPNIRDRDLLATATTV